MTQQAIPSLTPRELEALLQGPEANRPLLLDVRRPDEHALVALPDSILIPVHDLDSEAREEELQALKAQGREVVVYCHHGVRSLNGTLYLLQRGFRARSLAGGIERYAREVDPSLPRY